MALILAKTQPGQKKFDIVLFNAVKIFGYVMALANGA